MICSMTAFARREQQSEGWLMTWELRSVNHRYADIAIRLPELLRFLETGVRDRVNRAVSRGKVECTLKFQATEGARAEVSLNRPLAQRLLAVAAELDTIMGARQGLRPVDILRWPGAVSEPEPDLQHIGSDALMCLDEALTELVATRRREGERLADMIRQRSAAMGQLVTQIRARRPEVVARLREKLLTRLAELPLEPDMNRLEQEMAIVAQRLDVAEELDRLDAHLAEIGAVLQRQEPVGRRLDFLTQELNREANTLASKSSDAETTRATVELKVLIEQMREQIQNIE